MGYRARCLALTLLLWNLAATAQSAKPAGESSSKPHARARENSAPDLGSIADGVYRNPSLNFSYKIPFGWVDRTSDMRAGSELGKSVVLLSVFERPPEVQGEGLNAAVVIAAENTSSYPGLKSAGDYFGPITELATSRGFKATNEPYEFSAGARQVVRGDFSKQKESATVQQTSLVYLRKNWIVSFTFLAGSDDEMDDLIAKLSFGGEPVPHPPKK